MNSFPWFVREILASRLWPLVLLALIAVLYAPSLDDGWRIDDHFHRAMLQGQLPGEAQPAWNLFDFARLEQADSRHLQELSMLPWWSEPGLRLSFLRPISGLSHGLDYRWWPQSPAAMHAHSIAWFMVACLIAWGLFRSWLEPRVAGLATLILVVDDTFAVPVGWLANRNAVLALAFGLAALLAHDLWRRGGWRGASLLGPLCLLAAVLANEGAIAIGAYLLAYAAFLDSSPRRWLALGPYVAVGLAWAFIYMALDYGIRGSGVYVHPLGDPVRFLSAAAERLPLLFWGQWAFPSPEAYLLLAPPWRPVVVGLGLVLGGVVALLLWPLRDDKRCRFFAAGMLLSLLPACSTFPANRLLVFASLGGAGLLAMVVAHALTGGASRRRRVVVGGFLLVHLVLAPLSLGFSQGALAQVDRLIRAAAASLEASQLTSRDTLVLVDAPTSFIVAFVPVLRAMEGESIPSSIVLLSSGLHGARVERLDERTVAVRPVGGYLVGRGREPAELGLGPVSLNRGLHLLDHLYRAAPFDEGQRIELPAASVDITEAAEGRALEATFRFHRPLEDPNHRWHCWRRGGFEPCQPPSEGQPLVRPSMVAPPD